MKKNTFFRISASRRESSVFYSFLRLTGIAALTTVFFYLIAVLINHGSLLFDKKGNFIFSQVMPQEILFTFLFLFCLLWAHSEISRYFNYSAYWKRKPLVKAIFEIFIVILISLLLLHLVWFLPFFLLFPDVPTVPEQLRSGYVLSCFFSLFFYFFVEREKSQKIFQAELLRSARLQKENFQAQAQHLKNQVSPHFLFNSLNVLGSLIKRDRAKARLFTRKLSEVYRTFLNHSDKQVVPLRKELELTKAYIFLLETRFGSTIEFELNVESSYLNFQLPPGSLQMLVENVVKHNGSTARNPLKVSIFTEEDTLVVHNPIKKRKETVKSSGTGLINIVSRYRYLSNRGVKIEETQSEFTVKLPLFKIENNESGNH